MDDGRIDTATGSGEAALERARLVRLCSQLTGDPEAAEDLAQETLLEGWRLASKLRDEAGRFPWLAAIARNLCRRWARSRQHDLARLRSEGAGGGHDSEAVSSPWSAADVVDAEVELERHELALLLDRALALLPPDTRQALVDRYVHESPVAEIAARLGVSTDAVAMRLSRGKLHLRRLLTRELHAEAAAFGLCDPDDAGWEETRIWCPTCGRRRLLGCFERPVGRLAFRCPACTPDPNTIQAEFCLADPTYARLVAGISRYKPALGRMLAWVDGYYRAGLAAGVVACTACDRPTPLRRVSAAPGMAADSPPRLAARCAACGAAGSTSLAGLVLAHPAVRRFWQEHPRMRTLPAREIDVHGRPALVVRVEAVANSAGLDIVSDRDSYAVVEVHPDSTARPGPTVRA